MTTFRTTQVKSELVGDDPLSDYALGYLNERARNNFYDYVLRRFHEAVEKEKLTKAKLARRLGLEPARITRLLGSPGNWTLDTVSELLVGICREELKPQSEPYLDRPVRNLQSEDLLRMLVPTPQTKGSRLETEIVGSQTQANSTPMDTGLRLPQTRSEISSSVFG